MDRSREQALVALHMITGDGYDDSRTAERLGSHEAAAEAMSILAGYLLEALALHRGEAPAVTARFIKHLIQGGPGEGLAGVPAGI